jgi:hypothetical protein
MKLQPTCAICLGKIKIIDQIEGQSRKLLCKHVFHETCISKCYKPQCPLCEHPIFNKDEESLLTCSDEQTAVKILQSIDIKNMFFFLTTHSSAKKYKWIVDLMYKFCDFTELLVNNLDNNTLVKEIVTKGKVNWFKTFFGGITLFDLIYENVNDPEITDHVYKLLPVDHRPPTDPIPPTPPTSPSPTPPSPLPTPPPSPPSPPRNQTHQSLYPSLTFTDNQEPYYYEPSAPPIY